MPPYDCASTQTKLLQRTLSPRVSDNRTDDAMTKLSYAELDKETIAKAYARWAPVYDVVFGAVFERGRQAAIAAAERIGGGILLRGGGAGGWLAGSLRGKPLFAVGVSEALFREDQPLG